MQQPPRSVRSLPPEGAVSGFGRPSATGIPFRRFSARKLAATLIAALGLVACGGGADGGIGGTGGGGGGGIGGTGIAYGGITGFGSVWVNGVRYDTQGASFRLNGDSVSQNDLRIGMVARVEGSGTTATSVVVFEALNGRVEQVTADSLVVLGQTVRIDTQTQFEDGIRPVPGELVEVYGLPVSAGVLAASYIDRESAPSTPPFKVTGFVSAHDASARSLNIGSLVVQYAGADVSDMGSGGWVGRLVEVKGIACAGNPVCGTLTASRVEPAGSGIASSPKAEVEGFITVQNLDGFSIGDLRVVITAATVFKDGLPTDAVVGARVEAEGPIVDGVMTAAKVEIDDSVKIEGNVQSVNGDLLGITGLPGIEVQVTSFTELEGIGSTAGLAVGQHVSLKGRLAVGSVVVATELKLKSARPDVELQAPVQAAGAPLLTLMGLVIDTTGLPDSAFRHDDTVIGRSAFFAALATNVLVKASGRLTGGSVVWDALELDD